MKKFSVMFMSIVLLCFCTLFSACTPKNPASITLSKTNATIYLGETENNEVAVTATLNNVDVKSLDLVYDTTYINVSQTKNQDGSFTIVVASKVSIGTNAIAVEVKAGKLASAIFYVDIVLPVERIVAKENLFVAYNKEETKYNLLNCITFEPAGTKQTDVEFTLVEDSENYSISGNILTIKEGLNAINEQIKVNVVSTVEGKSDVATQLNIKLIPNVKLLANNIQTLLDYNGEENIAVENKTYELSIEKKSTGFVLSTFKVKIAVPQALGLNVDVDLSITPSILDYLSYSKMHTQDTTNATNVKDVYTFTFEAKSGGQGEGYLRFKFYYADYPSTEELSSCFVGYDKLNNSLIESINVVVTMPISSIEVQTDCLQNAGNEYILYKTYNNAYGQAFRFVAIPEGTSQNELILQKTTDSNLSLCDSKGNSLVFDDNNNCKIKSGDVIYIKGGETRAETLKCYSAIEGKESIYVEANFSIVDGATALGFVDSNTSTDTKEEISLNAEVGKVVSAYIYAPGVVGIADFTYDTSVEIKSDVNQDYFVASFPTSEVGKHTYTFATANGFIITAHVNVIQPITNASVILKDNAEYISGIGQFDLDKNTNELLNISIENGYSVELDFIVNLNATISHIQYSFYEPVYENVYVDYFEKLKIKNAGVYSDSVTFTDISSILNTQSLVKYNLISANFVGVNIVKIEIFGQSVNENGELVDEIKSDLTKYIFVQVYNPVKSIVSTAKNITLRAKNQLSSSNASLSTKTLSIDVFSDGEQTATYDKLFFDRGKYDVLLDDDGNTKLVCSTSFYDDGREHEILKIDYDRETKKLKIDALYVDERSAGNYKLVLFAGDFVNFANGETIYSDLLDVPFVAYVININLIQTDYITDISVSNLTLVGEDETTKTYSTIYIDTSKSLSVTYKLFTQVEPIDAFEKDLVFNYTPNSGNTQAMLDIAQDGTITVLGQQGGVGVITITPAYVPNGVKVKTVIVPIVVTDGNSWETAYEITSLDEIVDPNKHYVLTIPTTYTLTNSLFENVQGGFKGGIYGRRYLDENADVATIKLQNVSLFNVLASTARIACLNICGDVSAPEYLDNEQNSVSFTSRGFVANVSAGTIENVKITTFVKNGIYVPSLLTIGEKVTIVGGVVGDNYGTIKNCTFAGSINIEKNSSIQANAIAGSNTGTIDSCNVIVAKFDSSLLQEKRVIQDGENYINGVIGGDGEFKDIDNIKVAEKNYADYVFEGNVSINNYSQGDLKFSYGEDALAGYGLVFFYKAKQASKQSKINGYNTILFDNLFAIAGSTSIETKNLKVTALNLDGSVCNLITINPENIIINGVGEFILKITSEFDYTKSFEMRMLSLYYASDFSISSNGSQINNASVLKIVYGHNHEIITRLTNRVIVNSEVIELEQNDFNVLFSMIGHNATDYITNNKLGSHTINMSFDWYEITDIVVQLQSGFNAYFDTLLNSVFELSGEKNAFKVQRKNGTTDISSSISEGAIEPKDTLNFVATLTTDLPEADEINDSSIYILNEYNMDVTSYFTLFVEKLDLNNNIDLNDDSTFKISLSVNPNLFKDSNLLNLVNKTYKIVIKAKNSGTLYDSLCEVTFTLLPQAISNINTTLYNITSSSTKGFVVSSSETPTSVLIPSLQGGLFVIDMFPSYASYDHIEVVATANTMSKLSFRLQNKIGATSYSEATSGFEAILGQNGIRIFNTTQGDNQNIGTYYLKVFADSSTFTDNTIFTITVTAFYNGEKLPTKSIFSLHMRMPDAPQLSLNGQTKVYALAGQTISNITCLIANDQINPIAYIAKVEGTNNSAIDGKSINKIHYSMVLTSQNDVVGYKKYLISITFDDDYVKNLDQNSTKFKLVVRSTKIANGNQIPVYSEMNIYIVDYTVDGQDIVIFNAIENTFKVTSIKSQELKLSDLVLGNINATQEFIDKFNENYYFNNEDTGFVFGSNIYDGQELTNKAQVLASYISYVNDNIKTPLLKVNASGNLEVVSTQYLTFDIENRQVFNPDGSAKKDDKGNDIYTQHLMVRGGSYTGTTNMILEIKYVLPDGRIFTYEYRFDIVNSQYTSEDLPKEISNADAFLGIANETEVQDYILTNDLYLYDFTTINNTDKISYLDGNNHTINIISFADDATASNFALFNQISSGTTIKNLTVNLYHLRQIAIGETTKANIAGFAIQNNGAIYNCEVLAYKNGNLATTSSTFGIKVDENVNVNVAGFVLNNNGSITNSRVGGTSKLITYIEYIKNDQDIVTNRIVKEIETPTQMFTIRASGTVSGFVENNNGVIASCFVKNVNIQNTYFKQESMVTSGFVNTNSGTIALSYVEGAFANKTDAQAELGGLEGSGIMSGFVYVNSSKITDCYSNIKLTNTKEQVGRLGAGFVFENSEGGVIERCYSASKVISNNITQMNFAGIKDFGGYNNQGTIKTSYYYIRNSSDTIAIESVLGTSINAVSDINDSGEFYGFSFKTKGTAGTWLINNGPRLVSADDITHSLRAKYENPNKDKDGIDYTFVYCDGYELGSVNNPITIKNAKEFNSVFGASSSTSISDNNYSVLTQKVYGAYRIVNNINMLELVPEEEQETEYKVNLVSTKMTLSGEYTNTSNRNGSLNGNGLTISNLAISNSSTTSDGFGLFKSIENGASICNINVEISSAGVSADHTVFVGTLAGTLKDSYAYNIDVKSENSTDYTLVIGANVTGGVFGRVIGDSRVSNISVKNISAISTNYTNHTFNNDDNNKNINAYNRKANAYNDLSIAGGAFGVVDIYDKSNENDDNKYGNEDYVTPNITNIAVTGGIKIEGMTAGGLVGYIGNHVIARDLSLTILRDELNAYITAYNCFAGGIAGYNRGYLYQIKAEHEKAWQDEIESNIHSYYMTTSELRDDIDRGNLNIFDAGTYKPYAIGGLIGYSNGGKISVGYSKLNVINEYASYAGGLIGYVCKQDYGEGEETDNSKSLTLHEVYAVGDVYSKLDSAYVGGLVGFNNDSQIKITKLNAMNYWGHDSYLRFYEISDRTSSTMNGSKGPNLSEGSGESPAGEDDHSVALSIKAIEFVDGENGRQEIFNESSDVLNSYYSYGGVLTDNGAQIDIMFKEKEWYIENNWSRDLTEMFPHILYVLPKNTYTIANTNDFYKFILYGNDPNVTFIVIDNRQEDDNLVDCSGWQTTLGLIRGNIIGATSKNGFKKLNVPLFAEAYGNEITNLTFKDCDSALVQTSNSVKYRDLNYERCDFKAVTKGNLGGVTQNAEGNTSFSNINFSNCTVQSSANNAGFLFGGNGESASSVNITISGIRMLGDTYYNVTTNHSDTNDTANCGMLFGTSTGSVTISSAKIIENAKVTISEGETGSVARTINVGLIAGKADKLTIDLSELSITEKNGFEKSGFYVGDSSSTSTYPITLCVGGIVGSATELSFKKESLVSGGETEAQNNISFAPNISVIGISCIDNLYLGTACGVADTLKADNNIYILGQSKNADQKTIFKKLNYDFVNNNYIGGIAGSVRSVTASDAGVIAYYGDMIVNATTDIKHMDDTFLNVGGLFGTITPTEGATEGATISNVLFDGTFSFDKTIYEYYKNKKNQYDKLLPQYLFLRVGGVVGYNPKNTELAIKNSVVAGEIILPNVDVIPSNPDVISSNSDVILLKGYNNAGIVGLNDGTLALGESNENIIVLTTIFSNSGSDGIDIIANNGTGSVEVNKSSNIKYCSSLTLAVTDKSTKENPTDVERIINTSYDQLCTSTQDGEGNDVYENGIWNAIQGNTVKGSKLDPYILGEEDNTENNLNKIEDSDDPENEYFYRENSLSGKDGTVRTYSSKYIRKLYLSVKENKNTALDFQISLNNTILFSTGASLYSNITPIHKIDSQSAVSGLVVKIYIDEINEKLNSSKFVNYGGLANINEGIIYTCSVQEKLTSLDIASTQFYGYMNINSEVANAVYDGSVGDYGAAGFVAYNKGYIFGSNSNVHIKSSNDKVKLNGFVGLNKGTISYCYASGINENTKADISGKADIGGLFAGLTITTTGGKQEVTFNGEYDHCYTIVMAKGKTITTGKKTYTSMVSEVLPDGVFAEKDAVEKADINGGNEKTLYNNVEFAVEEGDNENYYAIEDGYNYNYPTLSNGPFVNFDFLKHCTLVEYNSSNLTYNEKDPDKTDEDYIKGLYFQIPNLTVLKELCKTDEDGNVLDASLVNFHTKFVIISDINVGYDNDLSVTDIIDELKASDDFVLDGYNNSLDNIKSTTANLITSVTANNSAKTDSATIKNITFGGEITIGSESENGSTGIIGSISAGVTLSNIKFESDTNVTIKTNNYSSDSHIGVLVGENNGTVQNCKATYKITTNGGAKAGYILGGLVGLNNGTVTDCTFNGSVYIDETLDSGFDNSVTFGGIIGENKGTATKLRLDSGTLKTYCLTNGGEVFEINSYDDFIKSDNYKKISTEYEKQQYKEQMSIYAQIFVRTNNKAIVGGLVGINTNGTISMSYTYKNIDSYNHAIHVGDEYKQMIAYAGGIAGVVAGGYVQDCSNLSNVTAMSVWQFTTNENDKAKYRINITEDKYSSEVELTDNTEDPYGVIYKDDNIRFPATISERSEYDSEENKVYIYREMTSLAFAGGIAGAGIKTASTDVSAGGDANVRLANYGNIAGGFRAEKPILEITATKVSFSGKTQVKFWSLYVLALYSKGLVSKAIATYKLSKLTKSIYNATTSPQLNIVPFDGNSFLYYCKNASDDYAGVFLKKVFDVKDKLTEDIADQIQNALGYNVDDAEFNNDKLKENIQKFYCPDIEFCLEALFATLHWSLNGDIIRDVRINKLTGTIKYSEKDYLKFGAEKLKSYSYDGICPDLKDPATIPADYKGLMVFSNTSNYNNAGSTTFVKLKSGNSENNKLQYSAEDLKEKYTSAYTSDENLRNDWSEPSSHPWMKLNNKYCIPEDKDALIINVGAGDDDIQDNGDGYSYTLKSPADWRRIVYTINDATNNPDMIDIEKEKYQSMSIIVDMQEGESTIDVGTNTLDIFNGSIYFNSPEFSFSNLDLTNGTTNGCGIIKTTNGCTLTNIKITGNASISISNAEGQESTGTATPNYSAGLLIGYATEEQPITIANLTIDNVTTTISSSDNISSLGLVIGSFNKPATTTASVDPDTESSIIKFCKITNVDMSYINEEVTGESDCALGGIIGTVNNNIILDEITLSETISLKSNFNCVGGLVGKIGDNSTLTIGKDKASTLNANIMASSNKDTYVGGLVGYNGGNIVVSKEVYIGMDNGVVISADVTDSTKKAYAGGLVGYSGNSIELNAKIDLGKNGTSYDTVSYVFAGFNLQNGTILPRFANADYAIGSSEAAFSGSDNYSYQNTIVRYMYRETMYEETVKDTIYINWGSIYKGFTYSIDASGCEIKPSDKKLEDNYVSLFTTTTTTDGNYLVSEEIIKDEIEYEDEDGNSQTASSGNTYYYTQNGSTEGEKITLTNNIISQKTQKLAYSVKTLKSNLTTSDNNVKDYQWLLSVNYKEVVTQYNQKTSAIDATYKFLITLTSINAKLDDTGKYLLVVTKLNGYEKEEEYLGSVTVKDSDGNTIKDKDGNEVSTTTKLYKTTYTGTDYKKVLFSENITLNKDEVPEKVEEGAEYSYGYSSNYGLADQTNIQKTISHLIEGSTEEDTLLEGEATYKHNNFIFGFEKDASDKINFVVKENLTLSMRVDYSKSKEDVEDIGDIHIEDITDEAGVIKQFFDYTRTLISISDLPVGTSTDNESSFAQGLNPASNYIVNKVDDSGNKTPIGSGTYTQNSTLNGTIRLEYKKPTYKFNDKSYAYVQVSTSTIKEQKYIFVTCLSDNSNVTEYVYRIGLTTPTYCGYISYTLSSQDDFVSLFLTTDTDDHFVGPDRYESFFPILEANMAISNIVDNIKEKAENAPTLEIKYQTYDVAVNIKSIAGDLFYTYEVITTTHYHTVTIDNKGICSDSTDQTNDTTYSGGKQKVYFTGTTALDGLLKAEEATIITSSTPPAGVGKIENCTEYYVYNNNLVGYKTEEEIEITVTEPDGTTRKETIKQDKYYYYRDGKSNGSYELLFYASTGEFDASKISIS